MQTISETVPLEGALKCSTYLSSYFNMPLTSPKDIETANKTLNLAFDCLTAEGIPFFEEGCDLKYEMDKDTLIPSVYLDEAYYKSACYSNTLGYYYP